jgi:hypothetical protein
MYIVCLSKSLIQTGKYRQRKEIIQAKSLNRLKIVCNKYLQSGISWFVIGFSAVFS